MDTCQHGLVRTVTDIGALIDYGEITIGVLRPVGCIATACDEDQTYYCWKAKYGGMESGDARKLKQLEDENRKLTLVVAELMLDYRALKVVLAKNV